jgi:MAGE family
LVVRHAIFSNTEKPGIPIPRTEITKLIADNSASFSKRPGLPSLVIAIAQAKLAECFGMEMVELTKARMSTKDRVAGGPPVASATGEGTKHFVLRSIVPPALYSAAVAKKNSAASNGFLAVILSIIDMAGGSIEERELWKHLGDLAVQKAVEHPHLGMPQELIEEFIKKRQIHVERISGNDGAELYYSIAENATSEIGDAALKSFYEAEFS